MGITPSASINAIGHKERIDAEFPTRFSIRQHALIAPRNSPWQLLILIRSYQLKINKAQANNTNAFWDHINLSRTPTRTSTPKLTPNADIDFDIPTELEVLKRRRNYLDFDAHATCQRIPDKYEICIRIKRDGRKMENSEGRWRRFYTII